VIRTITAQAIAGQTPAPQDLEAALDLILKGEVEPVQIAGLLVALATRPVDGPTLAAAARVLRAHQVSLPSDPTRLVDTCGTGGDGAGTFNISTTAAFVLSAAGCQVAKHGNRGVSSGVGSADVLESLGCPLTADPEISARLLSETGFAFLYAPAHHPALATVGPIRKALGIRTIFNLLGPLVNPACARRQLIGVFDPAMVRPMAEALLELESERALVVHCEGLDEIGLHAPTQGVSLEHGTLTDITIDPTALGFEHAPIEAPKGGDAAANAATTREVLGGAAGPKSDIVALNAGVALSLTGVASDHAAGVELARELLSSGAALRALDKHIAAARAAATAEGDTSA